MAAIDFPNSPSNGQIFSSGGKSWKYNSAKGIWQSVASTTTKNLAALDESIVPSANVTYDLGSTTNAFRDLYLSGSSINLGGQTITANATGILLPAGSTVGGVTIGTGSGGATQYANASLLPTSGLTAGEFAFVGNTLFMTNGTGWYSVALINQTPELTLSTSSITLGSTGNTINFTFTATDPDGPTPTVTVSNSGIANTSVANVNLYTSNSTVTVENFSADPFSATITLTASDGINQTFGTVTLNVVYLSELWDETALSIGTSSTDGLDNDTFIDRSTNTHTVTPSGTPVQTAFHPYLDNWSVGLDGTSTGFIQDTTSSGDYTFGTGDFTIEAFVNFKSFSLTQYIWSAYDGALGGFAFYHHSSSGLSVRYGDADVVSRAWSPNLGQWYHVAISRESGTMKMFVDGTLLGTSFSYTTNIQHVLNRGSFIGQYYIDSGTQGGYFNGHISNLRIVKGTSIYNADFDKPTENLTDITNTVLLTCQSRFFIDNSSYAQSFTVGSGASVSSFNPFSQESEYAVGENKGSTRFNKTNYLTYPQDNAWIFGTDDVTMEAWVYPIGTQGDEYTATGMIYGKATGSGAYWFNEVFRVSATHLYFSTNNYNGNSSSALASAANVITTNQWHHVVFTQYTIDGTRFWSLYCNGDRVYHASTTNSLNVSSTGWTHHTGYYPGNAVSYDYNGYISDLKISKSALYTSSSYTIPTSPLENTSAYLYLPMDNAGIFDKTGNHTLTLVNGTSTSTTQNKYADTSIILDGVDDYAYINTSGSLSGDFTIEMWAYVLSTGTASPNMRLFTCNTGGNIANNLQIAIGWQNLGAEILGAIFLYSDTFIVEAGAGTAINDSAWHHIAVTRSGSSIKLFIDGTQSGSTATNSTVFSISNTNIGTRDRTGGHDHFHGYIENLQIINGVAKYTTNFTPPTGTQGRSYQATS